MTNARDPSVGSNDPLLAFARTLLEREGADADTSAEVALAAAHACEKLCAHLGRIVGRVGIAALFARCVGLTRARFPWIESDAPGGAGDHWKPLRLCLAAQEPAVARDATLLLVTSLLGLIGGLIGDALVLRLLTELWPEAPSDRTKEVT